jgi:MYXO-CTERM domain-containing protein
MLSRALTAAAVLSLFALPAVGLADAGPDTGSDAAADAAPQVDAAADGGGPGDAASEVVDDATSDAATDAVGDVAADVADAADDGVELSRISPGYGYADSETEVEITGSGLDNTLTFVIAERDLVDTVFPNRLLAIGVVPTNLMAPGIYDLEAFRGDTLVAEIPDAFEVLAERDAAPPVISGVFPPVVVVGRAAELTVSGSGFQPGAVVELSGIRASGTTVDSLTELRVAIDPGFFMQAGPYSVTVENPDGQSATLAGGLLVRPIPSDESQGCASTPAAASGLWGVFLAALLTFRRRRV